MRQAVRFGDAVHGSQRFAGKFRFAVPRFGRACVCCNGETYGLTKSYDPSTDRVTADRIEMPVCAECQRHVMASMLVPSFQGIGIVTGAALSALGISYTIQRPGDAFTWGFAAVGLAIVVACAAWIVATHRREARARDRGHHPGIVFSVAAGRSVLATDNAELIESLLELNPNARRMPTPWLWRRRANRAMPKARAVDRGER